MSGTRIGGLKARDKNLARDPDFYRRAGRIGGQNGHGGGFASDLVGDDGLTGKERARIAGAKGGRISRRGVRKEDRERTPLIDEYIDYLDSSVELLSSIAADKVTQ